MGRVLKRVIAGPIAFPFACVRPKEEGYEHEAEVPVQLLRARGLVSRVERAARRARARRKVSRIVATASGRRLQGVGVSNVELQRPACMIQRGLAAYSVT